MSQCNYCTMKAMKARAKKNKTRIVTFPSREMGSMGGIEVHEVKKGEKPTEKNFCAWFMEVTDYCCC